MAKMQRISRSRKRELVEPDKFITRTARLLNLFARHRRSVLLAVAAFFGIAAVLLGVRYFSQKADARAFVEYTHLAARHQAMGPAAPAEQVLKGLESDFQAFLDRHGKRQAGRMARLALADLYFRSGRVDDAQSVYERLHQEVAPDAFAHWAGKNGAAYAYAAQGQVDKALAAFGELVDGPVSVFRADALYQLGRLYAAKGQGDKSRETYARLLNDYPGYVYADMLKAQSEG
jgi:tetratricopeptide (TPR) repeat protein